MKNIFLNFFNFIFNWVCSSRYCFIKPSNNWCEDQKCSSFIPSSSLSSNQIIRNYQDEILDVKEDVINKVNNIVLSETLLDRKNKSANLESSKTPIILASYSVDSIEISEVIELEPLP